MASRKFNKIFCIGEGKTGTTSLHQAFLALGLKSIHHSPPGYKNTKELKDNARLINNQIEECRKKGEKLLQYIDDLDAYCDIWGIRQNFELLDRQYPNSKFIYTNRDTEKWLDSLRRHVARNVEAVENEFYETKLISVEEEKWIKNKTELLERIKQYFQGRPKDLLFIDITKGDGYDKFCPFLGLEVPKISFPKSNVGSEVNQEKDREIASAPADKNGNSSTAKNIKKQFIELQQKSQYSDIARLITHAFEVNSTASNKEIFGYIPRIFREVEINKPIEAMSQADVFFDEPVVYKIYFPHGKTICQISYFYIFCYLKSNIDTVDVYFQSAVAKDRELSQELYDIKKTNIGFEGISSAFNNKLSFISVSDPGHFIPGLFSSFYVGTPDVNIAAIISQIIEKITALSDIKPEKTFLFGSSAGSMGALMSSTYFSDKVNVMAVNSQITVQSYKNLIHTLLDLDEESSMNKFAERISCIYRFRQKSDRDVVPNIYIMANINDGIYNKNYSFYQLYQRRFTNKGIANQSIFDSYYGAKGHGRPKKTALKAKIKIAKASLMLKSD